MTTRMLRRALLLRAPKPISSISANTARNFSKFTVSNETSSFSDSPPFPLSNLTSYLGFSSLSEQSHGPATVDYCSMLQEDEYQRLANSTIHDLLEKLEEYGDSVDMDAYDVDYGNEVLTLKLGSSGTYVINKQTPNRQIWMSSPISGPSRFDWDQKAQAWIYRRTKQELIKVLETELEQLCGQPINLS